MSVKLVFGIMFALLCVAVGSLCFISYQYDEQVVESSYWVNHTHKVLEKADEVSSLFKELQLESNAFYIGGDTSLIKSYRRVARELSVQTEKFVSLLAKNKYQHASTDTLRVLLKNLNVFTDSIFLADQKNIMADQIQKRVRLSSEFRENISALIDRIKSRERNRLGVREDDYQHSIAGFQWTVIALLICTFLLIISTFFAVRHNFNKRIKVEDQLKSANELFAKLFYESPISIVLSEEATGIILNCNEVFCKTVNIPKTELLGKPAVVAGIFDTAEQRKHSVADAKKSGVTKYTEMYIKPRDKDKIWISISAETIVVNNKKCLLSAIMDLSTHKRAEEEIKKALAAEVELNRLKSNFVTLASHEFRTPLTTILSSAFLLENFGSLEKERASKHIARIKSSVKNLTSILDEFLSVTKIEEGHIHANIEKVDVRNFLEAACHNLQTFAKPGQSIIYQHAGETEAETDPVLLANILNNLVSNSIKYSPENSPILVSSSVNSNIHLRVADSGIGIPEEDQKHLFERFYRASNAGTVQGTGLGLHIMKHYVDMLHGSVSVASNAGKGTKIEVVLPQMHSA